MPGEPRRHIWQQPCRQRSAVTGPGQPATVESLAEDQDNFEHELGKGEEVNEEVPGRVAEGRENQLRLGRVLRVSSVVSSRPRFTALSGAPWPSMVASPPCPRIASFCCWLMKVGG